MSICSNKRGRQWGEKVRHDGGKSEGGDNFQAHYHEGGRNKRSVWTCTTQPFPEAHFATFPEKLIEPCILAGTSEKGCCVECGASWERIIKKGEVKEHPQRLNRSNDAKQFHVSDNEYGEGGSLGRMRESQTIGWQPTCKCNAETKPCVVLDPFFGSGTTGIVAYKHNRKFIGIDLSETYLKDIAVPRIERETRQRKLFC
jgi:hypothetical protein